jgi:2-oxoglutarate dehydrogenase E1 component
MLQIPIFHVNGEDPEAVAQVVSLALDFRREFKRDVVIDMYAYRRRGHNEGDEPAFTQPLMYREIRQRKTTRRATWSGCGQSERSREHRRRRGDRGRLQKLLERELEASRSEAYETPRSRRSWAVWTSYFGGPEKWSPRRSRRPSSATGSPVSASSLSVVPEDFRPTARSERLLDQRAEMADGKRPLDWSAAEALALATLAVEGHRIRITGQDSERGTFSHRHAVLHDFEDGRTHMPLRHLSPDQAPVEIVNSPLSEAGVLGFEYGYSLECPSGLVVWEAQFGDFANARR